MYTGTHIRTHTDAVAITTKDWADIYTDHHPYPITQLPSDPVSFQPSTNHLQMGIRLSYPTAVVSLVYQFQLPDFVVFLHFALQPKYGGPKQLSSRKDWLPSPFLGIRSSLLKGSFCLCLHLSLALFLLRSLCSLKRRQLILGDTKWEKGTPRWRERLIKENRYKKIKKK